MGGRERDILAFYEYKGVSDVGLLSCEKPPTRYERRPLSQMT